MMHLWEFCQSNQQLNAHTQERQRVHGHPTVALWLYMQTVAQCSELAPKAIDQVHARNRMPQGEPCNGCKTDFTGCSKCKHPDDKGHKAESETERQQAPEIWLLCS